jgi:NAD(P)-dependent dehydrogenase (short-subunit alcohol dehydrogenase family)
MKKVLITGAGSGLGRGTAIGLAQAGHRVIATTQIWPQVTELRRHVAELGLDGRVTVDKLDVLDDRVVLEAKRLLAHTGVAVTECARRTGFDDPANFSKFFRARAGLAPGAFAAKARVPANR